MTRLTGKHSIPIVILACALVLSVLPGRAVETLAPRLSDNELCNFVTSFSERGGFFDSDNFVSNERSFQHVLAELASGRQPGSAYVGVGPRSEEHTSELQSH